MAEQGKSSSTYLEVIDERGRVHIVPSATGYTADTYGRDHGITVQSTKQRVMPKGGAA